MIVVGMCTGRGDEANLRASSNGGQWIGKHNSRRCCLCDRRCSKLNGFGVLCLVHCVFGFARHHRLGVPLVVFVVGSGGCCCLLLATFTVNKMERRNDQGTTHRSKGQEYSTNGKIALNHRFKFGGKLKEKLDP